MQHTYRSSPPASQEDAAKFATPNDDGLTVETLDKIGSRLTVQSVSELGRTGFRKRTPAEKNAAKAKAERHAQAEIDRALHAAARQDAQAVARDARSVAEKLIARDFTDDEGRLTLRHVVEARWRHGASLNVFFELRQGLWVLRDLEGAIDVDGDLPCGVEAADVSDALVSILEEAPGPAVFEETFPNNDLSPGTDDARHWQFENGRWLDLEHEDPIYEAGAWVSALFRDERGVRTLRSDETGHLFAFEGGEFREVDDEITEALAARPHVLRAVRNLCVGDAGPLPQTLPVTPRLTSHSGVRIPKWHDPLGSLVIDLDEIAEPRTSATAKQAQAKPSALAASTLDLKRLSGQSAPPRDWLVEGLIPAGNVTLLYGDGGVGKSGLALQLVVAAAAGSQWIGQAVKEGGAIFLTAEDDRDELHRRLATAAEAEGKTLAQLADRGLTAITLADASGEPFLAVAGRDERLKETELWIALVERIKRERPAVVVLDTLSDIFGGNENVRTQARAFIAQLRSAAIRSGTAIVVIAHPSRAGLAGEKELNSAAGSSGSTAWNNSVRSRLYLSRATSKDKRTDLRELTVMKANYAQAGQKIRLQWIDGLLIPEAIATGKTEEDNAAEAESVFIDLLAAYNREGRRVGSSPGKNYAPTVFAKDGRSGMVDRHQLAEAMNRLFAREAIKVETEGSPSRQRERIIVVDDK